MKDNKLTVEIYGQQYTMCGRESSLHMKQVAQLVSDKMHQIAAHNPRLDTVKIAVLSAVNVADDYLKLKKEYDDMVGLLEEQTKGITHA